MARLAAVPTLLARVLAPLLAAMLAAQQPSPPAPPPPQPPPRPPTAPAQEWTTTLLAFTGFAHPDPAAIERSADGMVPSCRGSLVFYVFLEKTGELALALTRTEGAPATKIVTTCAPHPPTGNPDEAATVSADVPAQGETDTTPLGKFAIAAPGFRRIAIATRDGSPLLRLHSLVLTGQASQNARAITRERRNAASVHLGYDAGAAPEGDVEWFYCEVTPRTDPVHTFYMATGWSRGYFGMQVNSATERRLIFSVWDAGDEAKDRSKVAAGDRVQLVAKGDGVAASDFGNEGTGGHSHVVHDWRLGGTFQFLVHASTDHTDTTYTGWFRSSPAAAWRLVASFRAPKDGKGLRGLHSFVENFDGGNGDLARDCEFGNVWARTRSGQWLPLREAKFTHDPTGRLRVDRQAGVRGDRYYLRTGGFELPPAGAAVRRNDLVRLPDSARTHPPDGALPSPPAGAATK